MSIVMWKVLESQVASDEEDILYRRLEARLERVARESEVPVGAHWESDPSDSHADRADIGVLPPSVETDTVLLAPPLDVSVDLAVPEQEHEPVQEIRDETVVATEARRSLAAPTRRSLAPQPKPAAVPRDLGPRVTRAVARPREAGGTTPLKAVTSRPADVSRPAAPARRTTVRTTPSS
jgi:hypothetical protein